MIAVITPYEAPPQPKPAPEVTTEVPKKN